MATLKHRPLTFDEFYFIPPLTVTTATDTSFLSQGGIVKSVPALPAIAADISKPVLSKPTASQSIGNFIYNNGVGLTLIAVGATLVAIAIKNSPPIVPRRLRNKR